ncbi:MAG: hypothetical protein KIT09_30515 [Bryobacteraceae bacterium]|nr:hypothetical protein [Bryobacteraceae bacterium]
MSLQTRTIPLYACDGAFIEQATARRIARLDKLGLIRLVRHRKGHVNRAILLGRPGEPKPVPVAAYAGRKYSFRERLEHGHAWELKRLGGIGDGKTYAPSEIRIIFLQVIADCLVT